MTNKKIKVVTHNGGFHADDVCGVATLALLLGKDNIEIIRSRDPNVIPTGEYVLDVGGIYDPAMNRFDHHQEGGAGVRENGIPYAAFGLIWKKYGTEVCNSQEIANRVERIMVQLIDADDNGIELFSPVKGLRPFTFSYMVTSFDPGIRTEEALYDSFIKLVDFAVDFLRHVIEGNRQGILMESIVRATYEKTKDKRLIILDETSTVSRQTLSDILVDYPEPLYVVRKHENSGVWQVVAVIKERESYKKRKELPVAWAGKHDSEFAEITGVPDAFFCHNGRFMALARSKEGAIKLAELALAA